MEKMSRSEAQGPGPEDSEKRKHGRPTQAQRTVNKRVAVDHTFLYGFKGAPQKRKCRARRIQTATPAAQGGRVGDAIRILQGRCGAFPSTVLHKTSPQYLAARDQAVVGVRQGESGKKSKG